MADSVRSRNHGGDFANSAIVNFVCLSYNISSKEDVSMLNEVVFLKHVSLECFAKNYKFHLLMPINYSRSTEYGNILKIPMICCI